MTGGPMSAESRVWITYAWVDDKEGDFKYLVQELHEMGVEATYDLVALVPGQRLWQQIAERITEGPLDGWAYLITPASLASEACREELAYALDRALHAKDANFPLIALLHGVPVKELPPALRARLCVSLADPSWRDQVKAGLEGRPTSVAPNPQRRFIWRVYRDYLGQAGQVAVEVRPRFGEVMFWRFAVPAEAKRSRWGFGQANGGGMSAIKVSALDNHTGSLNGSDVVVFGAADRLSPGTSAYVVFDGVLPRFVAFGLARAAWELPTEFEIFEPEAALR
jgi:hypothetical protein